MQKTNAPTVLSRHGVHSVVRPAAEFKEFKEFKEFNEFKEFKEFKEC